MKHRQKRKTGRRHGHPTGPPLTCGEQAKGADSAAPEGGAAE